MWSNRLFEEMDRILLPLTRSGKSNSWPSPYPQLNVWDDGSQLIVEAEIPGLDKDSIDVSIQAGNTLTISGERQARIPEKGTWLRQECGYGRFSRTVNLPTEVDADGVEAVYEAGVLTLKMPKHERARFKKIEVKTQAE